MSFSTSNSPKLSTSSIEEVARASFCAFFAGAIKDMVFYGLDSYKITKQAGQTVQSSSLFRGVVPIAFSGSGVAFSVYFIFYYPIRNACMTALGPSGDSLSIFIASAASAVPSSLVGVPADVMKKQLVLRAAEPSGTTVAHGGAGQSQLIITAKSIYRTSGLSGFFLGWRVNIFRDIPYAGIKMSLYEALGKYYMHYKHRRNQARVNQHHGSTITVGTPVHANADKMNGVEAGTMGFLSGILTAVVTSPIDCVNTRIKSGELAATGMVAAHREIIRKDGVRALFRGIIPRCAIVGCGSTVFWYVQASLLALIQP